MKAYVRACLAILAIIFSACCFICVPHAETTADGLYEYVIDDTNNGVIITKYKGYKANVTVPAYIQDKPVTKVSSGAFEEYVSKVHVVKSIVIPNGVKSIGNSAFKNCGLLENIVIPDSVESIGREAFWCCGSLKSIVIPKGVTVIEYGTFYNCISLNSVELPDTLATIETYAFRNCVKLNDISLPQSLETMGGAVFQGCVTLRDIKIPSKVIEIRTSTFSDCDSLTKIVIPSNVISIGTEAFRNCDSLTSVVISQGTQKIGLAAFSGCINLKYISIPASVTSIENSKSFPVFEKCDSKLKIYTSQGSYADDYGKTCNIKIEYGNIPEVNPIAKTIFSTSNYRMAKKKVTIKWNKVKGAKGYQFQYTSTTDYTFKYKKSKSTYKTKFTIKYPKNTSFTQYIRYRVRAYKIVNGKRKYGYWSDEYTLTLTKK